MCEISPILREAGIGGVVYLQFNVNEFGTIRTRPSSNLPIRNWIKRHSTPFSASRDWSRGPNKEGPFE